MQFWWVSLPNQTLFFKGLIMPRWTFFSNQCHDCVLNVKQHHMYMFYGNCSISTNINKTNNHLKLLNLTFGFWNPGAALGQAQKCDNVKPAKWDSNPPPLDDSISNANYNVRDSVRILRPLVTFAEQNFFF